MDERGEKLDLKAADVLNELRKIGFSNMLDYLVIDQDGQPMVDLSGLRLRSAVSGGRRD